MRHITCDICGVKDLDEDDVLKVEVLDGEHPHNGSTMTKTVDMCIECAKSVELQCNKEFDVLVRGKVKR